MRYDEQPKDVLEQRNIEYEKILECCTEDWKKNREYISGWKINKSIRFYYGNFIIEKLEVNIYAEHKSIRND